MDKFRKLSIIIPVYNEIKTIGTVIAEVQAASVLGLEKEIILVDDASTDGTAALLKQINDPQIKVFYHETNQGKGAALLTGFLRASGDIVIVQDADLEYNPAEIQNVIKPIVDGGAQVVYGSRYLNPSVELGFWHSLFNKFFTRIGNWFTGLRITDIMTCYKAFDRRVLVRLTGKLQSKRFGFEPEVTARIAKLRLPIMEVPISYQPRGKHEGKHMNFIGQTESLWALIKYSLFRK